MTPLPLSRCTLTTALGAGRAETLAALRAGRTGLAPTRFMDVPLATWIGAVPGVDAVVLPTALQRYDCRNNRLAWLGLQQDGFTEAVAAARQRWGAARVGVFLGTSTSGLLQTELAYRNRQPDGALPEGFRYAETQNTHSVAAFVATALQLGGPSWVVSTACSSSAKVYGNAARMIDAGLIDAAVVGGVDSLCLTTLYGFNSLELLSPDICRPWDAGRRGLSIGEAAAFALVERASAAPEAWVLGVGESNDGYHMSTPHPEGAGAVAAMRAALAAAGLAPADIDYINLHGTATPSNDAAESRAVAEVFGTHVPCSSTKGATGHTLGAAGGVESVLAVLALRHGLLPGGLNVVQPDAALQVDYLTENRNAEVRAVLSNSFGFGGTNASLVLGGGAVSAPPTLHVEGVGLLGPGLPSWQAAQAVLRGEAAHLFSLTTLAPPARLPPAERRRAGPVIRLAMAIADEAVAGAGADPQALGTVFTSSGGEGANCHSLCETLASPNPLISPTRFTNSVHNAAAGYWHIAVGSRAASTSLCAFDGSFGAGLIEAATVMRSTGRPLLLVAYDLPYPEPLNRVRPIADNFGLALVLAPDASPRTLASLTVELTAVDDAAALSACGDASLDALRRGIPAAAALPLLQALARRGDGATTALLLGYLPPLRLRVTVDPGPHR